MSNVVELRGSENGETSLALRPYPPASFRASLTGAAGRLWRFAPLWAEGLGWLVIVASIIAAVL